MMYPFRQRFLIGSLTFISGFASLSYQIIWHRYLGNLLGIHAAASAVVLGVFLTALGIGYIAFGQSTANTSPAKLLQRTAVLEVFIGFWGILFLFLYSVAWKYHGVGSGTNFLSDLLLTSALMAPSVLCMGGTLPLLTQGLTLSQADASWVHGRIYALNTLGASAGALGAAFFLIPAFGLTVSSILIAGLNILVGVGFLLISSRLAEYKPARESISAAPQSDFQGETHPLPQQISRGRAYGISFLVGFCALVLESLLIRFLGLSIGPTEYTYALVVGSYILLIAVGSFVCIGRTELRIPLWANLAFASLGCVLLYLILPDWPYAFHLLRSVFGNSGADFYLYHLSVSAALILLLFFPVAFLGSTLPLLFASLREHPNRLGKTVGEIYSLNSLGALIGAVSGYKLMTEFDQRELFILTSLCVGLMLALGLTQDKFSPKKWRWRAAIPAVLLVAFLPILPPWESMPFMVGTYQERSRNEFSLSGPAKYYEELYRGIRIIDARDDTVGNFAVGEFGWAGSPETEPFSRSLFVSGKPDGNTLGDRSTMELVGHLPALLYPGDSIRAAVVGYGTGMTIGALAQYPDVKKIDCIEISETVKEFAPYFDFVTHGASKDPKLNWIIDDAYRVLGSSSEHYELIISQPSNPWMAGIDRLYAKEFHELVRKRLSSDGLYVQWFGTWGLSPSTVKMLVGTIADVFPYMRLFRIDNNIVVVSSTSAISNKHLDRLISRSSDPVVRRSLEELNIPGPLGIMALEMWLPERLFETDTETTLTHPRLAYAAGADFFRDAWSEIEDVVPSSQDWRWSHNYAERSLLGLWVKEGGSVSLDQLLRVSCGGPKVKLIEPTWRYARTVCRDATVAYIAQGLADPPDYLQNEFAWLKRFLNDDVSLSSSDSEADPATLQREIDLFAQFHSIFLPLSAKRLMWRVSDCFSQPTKDYLQCRVQLVRVLAYTGYHEYAAQQMKGLVRDGAGALPTDQLQQLELLINTLA